MSKCFIILIISFIVSVFWKKKFILSGDYDAILSLLLLPRMIWKSEILMTHVRDKYPDVQEITKEILIKDHSAEQFATRSRLSFYLYSLQVYIYFLNYICNTVI